MVGTVTLMNMETTALPPLYILVQRKQAYGDGYFLASVPGATPGWAGDHNTEQYQFLFKP